MSKKTMLLAASQVVNAEHAWILFNLLEGYLTYLKFYT